MKRTVIKEVRYSEDEWKRILELSGKCGKRPAVYIRDKALNNKILKCELAQVMQGFNNHIHYSGYDFNNLARTVNENKEVFLKDVEDLREYVDEITKDIYEDIPALEFKEITVNGGH